MNLKFRIPEIFRKSVLAREESDVRRGGIAGERERERDLDRRAVGAPALALEVEHVEIADPGFAERLRVGLRVVAFKHQH